jgi:hypothetical protein
MTTAQLNDAVNDFENKAAACISNASRNDLIRSMRAAYSRFVGRDTSESIPGMQADAIIIVSALRQLAH